MKAGQSLSHLTARLLVNLEDHFMMDRPDLVLAHGDTTTCFTTAISSFYHQIPFFHVEAGLRSNRLNSPFPEEFNRQTIAPIARHHFAPTELEKENLIKDGVSSSLITVTGSTIHEAVQTMISKVTPASKACFSELNESRPLVLVTLHRRETTQLLQNTLHGLKSAALSRPEALFICPVHPNPLVQEAFQTYLKGTENIILTEPLAYPQFISLLMRSQLVVTDSGGVQEEAAFLGKKVLLARSETERTDGFESGLTQLIGLNSESIYKTVLDELSGAVCTINFPKINSLSRASEIISNEVQRVVG
ncbi:MAG: UDP-N-acetylglucosamine 2-epimerase (non-hydrolyzing) [Bdellovibrionaceae bacterium]|nr:UDP-N-acetylglucosamine 2-epimerase (non-hydrolyzing) [Pseudobdellovibrionaceae bacterium]